jgi:hypothetical protein
VAIGRGASAYVTGGVNVDQVAGDKITGGDISSIYGVPVSRSSTAQKVATKTGALDRDHLKKLFIPLMDEASNAPAEVRPRVQDWVNDLLFEMMSGSKSDDGQIASLIDMIASALPGSKDVIIRTFQDPDIKEMTGPVTHFMIERLEMR